MTSESKVILDYTTVLFPRVADGMKYHRILRCGLNCVQLFAIRWTTACQTPLSMGFPKQEYWMDCHFLLWGIFPTQGSNLDLLQFRCILYHWVIWDAYMILCLNFNSLISGGFCIWLYVYTVFDYKVHSLTWLLSGKISIYLHDLQNILMSRRE